MTRPLRVQYAGAVYHVTARGNERKAIFRADADRERFLVVLARAVERYRLIIHAYVLMENHYQVMRVIPGHEGQVYGIRVIRGAVPQKRTGCGGREFRGASSRTTRVVMEEARP